MMSTTAPPVASGSLGDTDLLEAASDVLVAIADVATRLGIKKLDRNFGTLGGELAALSELLEKTDDSLPDTSSARRIKKLFRELARACSVSEPAIAI